MRSESGPVRDAFAALQDRICLALEAFEPEARFAEERTSETERGWARPRVLAGGTVFEKSAAHFTYSRGPALPPAASERRPELAGRAFEAVSVSVIVHPQNPYVPTSHMNLRAFFATRDGEEPVWWFGGGFDLTPVYPFEEDARDWHLAARAACSAYGDDLYPELKRACDDYFYLPHREETRGVGGLFFDDFERGGFERAFGFAGAVGEAYLTTYPELVRRRQSTPFGAREREFQLYRRGRYVEFNLLYDRGTRYGLQSGRRVESVLASLPPLVRFAWGFEPEPGSPEAALADFLRPRDWL